MTLASPANLVGRFEMVASARFPLAECAPAQHKRPCAASGLKSKQICATASAVARRFPCDGFGRSWARGLVGASAPARSLFSFRF